MQRRASHAVGSTPRRRVGRVLLGLAAALLLLLALAKLVGPAVIEQAVEKSLEDMPGGYRGTLDGVELRMLDAEVALLGLEVAKQDGSVPVPFMKVEELVLGTVLDGFTPRARVVLVGPESNYVDSAREERKQTGPGMDLAKIREQLPFELEEVRIARGTVHFRNYDTKPPLDAVLTELELTWGDLVGCLPPGDAGCSSRLTASARVMEHAALALEGTFVREPEPVLKLRPRLDDLRLRTLSPLLRHYAGFDVEKGVLDLSGHLTRRGAATAGLLVPELEDFEVVGGRNDSRLFRELGAALAGGYFERKRGEKGIRIRSKRDGGFAFDVVDVPKSADSE